MKYEYAELIASAEQATMILVIESARTIAKIASQHIGSTLDAESIARDVSTAYDAFNLARLAWNRIEDSKETMYRIATGKANNVID